MTSVVATPPASAAARPLLDVRNLSIAFGGLKAVRDFSLTVPAGALYGLIGPNGAGKTTIFNLLTGVYRPDAGDMTLDGQNLTGRRPHEMTRAGLARTFQNIRLFSQLSVLDNVCLGVQLRGSHRLAPTLLRTIGFGRQEAEQRDRAMALLDVFHLADRADEPAGSLSYGHQRRLEILRALGAQPKVLLLDEPAAGLNPQEKRDLSAALARIRREFGVAVLLIEHDMGMVMELCERITVVDHGAIVAVGTPAEVQSNPQVIAAYLGVDAVD